MSSISIMNENNVPRKKIKTDDKANYFYTCLQESGLVVNRPPEKCRTLLEPIYIIIKLKKTLENHYDYPRNITELISCFEKECDNMDVFKYYLFPNILKVTEEDAEEHPVKESVVRILLSVPVLQIKITDFIFDKAMDLAVDCVCGPWINMILKNFTNLDSITCPEKLASCLMNLLEVASEKMVRLEIITAIPDIIGDQENEDMATKLNSFLSDEHEFIPYVLDCLSYLCLSNDQYHKLQQNTLNILMTLTKCSYFPNFVKFLLMPRYMNDSVSLETVKGLRNALDWPALETNLKEIETSQILTAAAIRNSIISSKVIVSAWIKVVSSCKLSTDLKPLDCIILVITYSGTEENKRQVENCIRKLIKANVLNKDTVRESFEKFKPVLKEYLQPLIELTNSLLIAKSDLLLQSFTFDMYIIIFYTLEECRQEIVTKLLQLGLDRKQCFINILCILNEIAVRDMETLKPQSLQMLTLLDRMDNVTLNEIREIMNLVCGLAYSFENSLIRDDIDIIMRKQLSSSRPPIKVQGILAGIYAVKYLMVTTTEESVLEEPSDISYSSYTHLCEGPVRDAAQVIELIVRSTRQYPDLTAFFYDELSSIVSSAMSINVQFLTWLTEAVKSYFLENFIVDCIPVDIMRQNKISMLYCLNTKEESDDVFAINIGGLAIDSKDDVNIGILSPLFKLVQTASAKLYQGDLSSIDALLGCPVVMPEFSNDAIDDMELIFIHSILDCLFHCANWFRELLNAFATQTDEILIAKLLKRILQIEEIEDMIAYILLKISGPYKPPVCNFNINKYIVDPIDIRNKLQGKKSNANKTPNDDTVLTETLKSQVTQTNKTIKGKIEAFQNLPFRTLSLNILQVFNIKLCASNELCTELNIKVLKYLLNSVNNNLESVLITKIKRNTFLSRQDTNVYDPRKAEMCAKNIHNILLKVMSHMKIVIEYIDKSNKYDESELIISSEMSDYLSCLELLYTFISIYFKWIGFKNTNNALLKSSLWSIVSSNENTTNRMMLKDPFPSVIKYFQNHEKYCIQLSLAVSLLELLKTMQNLSNNVTILKIMKNMAFKFLTTQWTTPDGLPEKGLPFNQSIDKISSIYLINNDIGDIKELTLQLTVEAKSLISKNNFLNSFKCFNKSNFSILYRNIGTAIHESAQRQIHSGLTDSEHLVLWKDVVSSFNHMSEIAKHLENRNNLSALFKKSLPILKLFLSQGMPIIEMRFKNETQQVLEIISLLQKTTRFLQSLCCHSRLKKDTVLMAKVPLMRQLLETLIYKVKGALVANKCSEAFWMGNLKNRNIRGEIIASQQSTGEESVEDSDDQLPEDEDNDSVSEIM